MNATMKI